MTCFFILCSVFEIHPCWWIQLWFHQAHISTEFHYVDTSLFISPSSYWGIFELLVICYYEQCCCGQFLVLAYTHVQEFSSNVYTLNWVFCHRIFSYSGLLCSTNLFFKVILSSYVSLQWYIKIHRVFHLPEDCQEGCQAFKFYQFGSCEMVSPWDFTLYFFAY